MTNEQIAKVCHEVNRAYCLSIGDESQLPWNDAPEWVKDSARAGVALHSADLSLGPEASHEAWMRHKLADGWVFGWEKNAERKEHPCLVPFDALPREQQAKDYIFQAVVHALLEPSK